MVLHGFSSVYGLEAGWASVGEGGREVLGLNVVKGVVLGLVEELVADGAVVAALNPAEVELQDTCSGVVPYNTVHSQLQYTN